MATTQAIHSTSGAGASKTRKAPASSTANAAKGDARRSKAAADRALLATMLSEVRAENDRLEVMIGALHARITRPV